MKKVYQIFGFLFLGIILLQSCRNETIVGAGILSDEGLELVHIDSVVLDARTVRGDSVITYIKSISSLRTYMMGSLEDNYFGKTEAEIYVNASILGNSSLPDFKDPSTVADSAFLILKLDTLGLYGDPDAIFDIEVFRLRENLIDFDTIYSDQEFMFDMSPLGTLSNYQIDLTPTIDTTDTGDTIEIPAALKIPIDLALVDEIILDTTAVKNDTTFNDLFSGFFIKATTDNGILAVDLSANAYLSEQTEFLVHYHTDTLENQNFGFTVGIVKSNRFKHDYTGSSVEEALQNPSFGDSLLFVESMAGTRMEFDLDTLKQFEDLLLNHASLELTVANLMDLDLNDQAPVTLLLGSEKDMDGDLVILNYGQTALPDPVEEFEENGVMYYRYNLLLTNFVKDILRDVAEDNTLSISAAVKSERPNRSIICGPKHSEFPSKLLLTFTKP